jgi:hypothetical protein
VFLPLILAANPLLMTDNLIEQAGRTLVESLAFRRVKESIMMRKLSAIGNHLLMMMTPRVEAAADPTYLECYCNDTCGLMQRVCGPGGCTPWYLFDGCITPTPVHPC